jgi:thioredoxin reductase (NADPH)
MRKLYHNKPIEFKWKSYCRFCYNRRGKIRSGVFVASSEKIIMLSMENVIIVGSGPAGLTAGIYAARAGFSPLVIEGFAAGGQLVSTPEVENFPGFAEPVSGVELMTSMRRQAERAGVRFALDEISSVDFSGDSRKLVGTAGVYEAKSVIIATGAEAKWTGLPGESQYRNHGISACATCDGAFHRGKRVVVIGGGDTALSDALHLSRLCDAVTIVHRRGEFRAAKVLADRVLETPNIVVRMNTTVSSFEGDGRKLESVVLSDGERLEVSGAFVAIGYAPKTAFLKGALELDGSGYVRVSETRTSVKGVFAAGDCADPNYKQAVSAAGTGAQAALEVQNYLAALNAESREI